MTDDLRLGQAPRALIRTQDAAVSVVSLWEMQIKNARGKLPLPPGSLSTSVEAAGFRVLPLTSRQLETACGLPASHSDPFDRLLVSIAAAEHRRLLTADQALCACARTDRTLALQPA